ncbi:MAG: hypothetical protein QNK11_05505 [Legionella sp.]|nr:hypothetical protein [Legionella sp.]
MKKFDEALYYREDTVDEIQPTDRGLDLLIQYSHDKYSSNICRPISLYYMNRSRGGGLAYGEIIPEYTSTFSIFSNYSDSNINSYLKNIRQQSGDCRKAFILIDGSKHAIFMVYIKEGNKEGILYSDSLSSNSEVFRKIHAHTGIRVFSHTDQRQADSYACYVDALVFARDTTGIDPSTGQYKIPNLLGLLEEQQYQINAGYSLIKLPHILLKTAQISNFIRNHKNLDKSDEKIHKNETLDKFRERYTESSRASYLKQKAIRYARIIQIQFYLNEIEKELDSPLSQDKKALFVKEAKKALKQGELHAFSESFLQECKPKNTEFVGAYIISVWLRSAMAYIFTATMPLVSNVPLLYRFNLGILAVFSCNQILLELESQNQENLIMEYGLIEDDFAIYQNKVLSEIEQIDNPKCMRSEKECVMLKYFSNKDMGLAVTKGLLSTLRDKFLPEFCAKIAQLSLKHAEIFLNSTLTINKFNQDKGDLFLFGYEDAYLANKLIELYPHLLGDTEKNGLKWVVTHKYDQSKLYSQKEAQYQPTEQDGSQLTFN